MQRSFLTRASAIAYLLGMRRATPDGIDNQRVGEADVRLQELDTHYQPCGKPPLGPPGESRIGDNRAAAEILFERTPEKLVDHRIVEIVWLHPANPAEEFPGFVPRHG